jgi:hypothetical protein
MRSRPTQMSQCWSTPINFLIYLEGTLICRYVPPRKKRRVHLLFKSRRILLLNLQVNLTPQNLPPHLWPFILVMVPNQGLYQRSVSFTGGYLTNFDLKNMISTNIYGFSWKNLPDFEEFFFKLLNFVWLVPVSSQEYRRILYFFYDFHI